MVNMQNISSSYGISVGGYNKKAHSVFAGKMQSRGGLETSGAFAADIVNRIKKNPDQAAQAEQQKHEADYAQLGSQKDTQNSAQNTIDQSTNPAKDLSGLQESLQNTIDYVAKRHGSQAATAVMGIMYQNVGMDNVAEDTLGQGFIQAVKFIDRNFGISEGNLLMGELNQGVNKEINEYFDNGYNEVFFDASDHKSALRTAKGIMQSMENVLDKALEGIEGPEVDLSQLGQSAKKMREAAMQALAEKMAEKMMAQGELPPAYTQEYLPAAIPGQLLNTAV